MNIKIEQITIFFSIVIISLLSCEKEITLELKVPEPALCLNCIMEVGNRDSIVLFVTSIQSVKDEGNFVTIDNADIILKKDGMALTGLLSKGRGKYIYHQAPEPGATYTVEVNVDGFNTLKAKTTVPDIPEAQVWFKKDSIPDGSWEKGFRIVDRLEVELIDNPGKDYYWFVTAITRDSYKSYGSFGAHYRTDNLLFDSFNRYPTQDYWKPFTNFEYYGALRLSDENFPGNRFTFSMTASNYPTVFIINADEHFDKHYKSSIKQFLAYEYDGLPIFEPVQIYSNIENGYGIFGSITVMQYFFDQELN